MSRADATPPAGGLAVQLHVNVPDINQFITVDIQPKMTIDEALERAIAKINSTASLKQPYTTETHGFYLLHQKIWCRNFMKLTDYKLDELTSTGQPQTVQLKPKSQFVSAAPSTKERCRMTKNFMSTRFGTLDIADISSEDADRQKKIPLIFDGAITYFLNIRPSSTGKEIIREIRTKATLTRDDVLDFILFACFDDGTQGGPSSPRGGASSSSSSSSSSSGPGASPAPDMLPAKIQRFDAISKFGFERVKRLEFRRVQIRLNVIVEGEIKPFVVKPDITTNGLIAFIFSKDKTLSEKHPRPGIMLHNNTSMVLDFNRTIRSYRVSPSDRLELIPDHIKSTNEINARSNSVFIEPSAQPGTQQELIVVTVISIEHETQRAIQVSRDATIAETIYHFTKRNIVEDPEAFGMFPVIEVHENIVGGIKTISCDTAKQQLEPEKTIRQCFLDSGDKLCFKRHGKVKPNILFRPQSVFGIELSELVMDKSIGRPIPKCLKLLTHCLYFVRGLDANEIFVRPGNPVTMKVIENQLIADTFPILGDFKAYDAHDVANLMKSWLTRLPRPILSILDPDTIGACIADEEEALELHWKLPEPYQSCFLWLIDLCAEIAKNSAVNNVDIHRISLAIGPLLFKRPDEPVARLIAEKNATDILTVILEQKLSVWGANIHSKSSGMVTSLMATFSSTLGTPQAP